jgi:hypothetical protein
LECGGWTPIWILWGLARFQNPKIQSGVEPPHSKTKPRKEIRVISISKIALALLMVLALLSTSCLKSNARKAVYPVHGRVLYEGQPLAQAFVVLHPLSDAAGPERPMAYSDSDGSFALTTYTTQDGAPAGDYAVTVEWRQPSRGDEDGPNPNVLAARYARPQTSGLRVRIDAGANELDPFQIQR